MNDTSNPAEPRIPKVMTKIPEGNFAVVLAPVSVNVGTVNGGGGVKVGNRVAVGSRGNADARIGSKVAVTRGVCVGGGSIT